MEECSNCYRTDLKLFECRRCNKLFCEYCLPLEDICDDCLTDSELHQLAEVSWTP